ncbi:hypothetical protein AWENTII_001414 [Aspergillus wentii]
MIVSQRRPKDRRRPSLKIPWRLLQKRRLHGGLSFSDRYPGDTKAAIAKAPSRLNRFFFFFLSFSSFGAGCLFICQSVSNLFVSICLVISRQRPSPLGVVCFPIRPIL